MPTSVPRARGQRSGQRSSSGRRGTVRVWLRGVVTPGCAVTICSSTSPIAKRPINTVTKSTPVVRNGTPKTKRSTPYCASVPTVPRTMPAKSEISAAGSEDWLSTETPARPKTTTEKNSTLDSVSAKRAKGGAKKARKSALTRPPTAEDMMASPSAYWVRPCWLSW